MDKAALLGRNNEQNERDIERVRPVDGATIHVTAVTLLRSASQLPPSMMPRHITARMHKSSNCRQAAPGSVNIILSVCKVGTRRGSVNGAADKATGRELYLWRAPLKVFSVAIFVAIALAAGAAIGLNFVQKTVAQAYSTGADRLDHQESVDFYGRQKMSGAAPIPATHS